MVTLQSCEALQCGSQVARSWAVCPELSQHTLIDRHACDLGWLKLGANHGIKTYQGAHLSISLYHFPLSLSHGKKLKKIFKLGDISVTCSLPLLLHRLFFDCLYSNFLKLFLLPECTHSHQREGKRRGETKRPGEVLSHHNPFFSICPSCQDLRHLYAHASGLFFKPPGQDSNCGQPCRIWLPMHST